MSPKSITKRTLFNTAPTSHNVSKRAISRSTPAITSRQADNSLAKCYEAVTPACVRALYSISMPDINREPNPDNSLGIYEAADYYYQQDLDDFFTAYASSIGFEIPNGTHPVLNGIDGGAIGVPWNSSINSTLHNILPTLPPNTSLFITEVLAHQESELDFTVAYPIVYPQTITLYQLLDPFQSSINQAGGYEDFLDAIDGVSAKLAGSRKSLIICSPIALTPTEIRLAMFYPLMEVSLTELLQIPA